MPGFDRTGPQGQGPQTGRGQGPCNPDAQPQETDMPVFGRGLGLGRGWRAIGRGLGRAFRRGWGRRRR